MYLPRHFEETRLDVLHALLRAHPLGTLVTQQHDGLQADHIPFEIAPPEPGAPFGVLRGHVARANPLWRVDGDALVVFQGAQAYITPSWYEEKAASGKVVPTYDYAVAHAHGRVRAIDDPAWLLPLLERLTDAHEAHRPQPWRVAEAPAAYLEKMLAAIVGIEIVPTRLTGKWKVSQNRSDADRAAIAAGLQESDPAMADLVRPA
jgi:transcriptional regulator